ncbi:MAG: cell surface protein SprA [Chitinophagales bacterium]
MTRHKLYTGLLTLSALGLLVAGVAAPAQFKLARQLKAAGRKLEEVLNELNAVNEEIASAEKQEAVLTAQLEPTPAPTAAEPAEPAIPVSAPEPPEPGDSLRYPIKERAGDHVTDKTKNPFYLKDPSNIKKDVEYDPATNRYIVTEKVGDVNIKEPLYLTYDEYLKYTEKQERSDYFKSRSNAITLIEDKNLIPPINMKNKILDRLFGGTKIEVKPQGNLDITLGGNSQYIKNPNIPLRNRKVGGFDFDMNINMNVIAKIGDKLQLGIKYNTQSGFDFDNQVKLGYQGQEDDIIKEISIGNVSMALPTRLINGGQALFGAKFKLQFGRLTWTSIISQQKSKRETIMVESGAQRQNFELKADQYDENRHFFLSQKFRNDYDYALSSLPIIKSVVNITRLEVWVTNRNGTTQNVRDVAALADLGEVNPHNANVLSLGGANPDNTSNNLYPNLAGNENGRHVDQVITNLQSLGLNPVEDFEKTYARKLQPTEYSFHPALGFISLNTQMNPNDVLAVAYQYEVNGKIYKVGEFAQDVPQDSAAGSKVLYLKLLKSTSIRPSLPYWDLMMKNVYSLGAYQVSAEDFRLDIYYNDPGGGEKRYLPRGGLQGKQLIKVLNLDNVNGQNDAQPDGLFDFIPGVTILPANGRIIFPVKEPFGQNLRDAFNATGTSTQISDQYVYNQLYDSSKFVAQQFPEFNRFIIRGQYKGSNSREINLGGSNIPRGSVRVSIGGQQLIEDKDYQVDYNLGKVTILDQGLLNSGQQIKVDFENNNLFGFQQRTLMGTRLDYLVNKKFNIGATVMRMSERPFTQKVNLGEDPIANTIVGADVRYETEARWLTKALDKLPIYSTKEMSVITAYGEFAHLFPGHQKGINQAGSKGGQVYLDDFEGASTSISLQTPLQNWRLASVPRNAPGPNGKPMFPEADSSGSLAYGKNRAKLAWYRIDNTFYTSNTAPKGFNADALKDPRARLFYIRDLFPNRPNQYLNNSIYPFDLALYPRERGPYNYDIQSSPISAGTNLDGSLKSPETRWGGIMRTLDNTDLEASNVEFIEFWMMDPFVKNPASQGGRLYFQLGNISEDVLRDSRMQFENGLSNDPTVMDKTVWGKVPRQAPLIPGFSNDASLRPVQDVGFDGLQNSEERDTLQQQFLLPAASYYGQGAVLDQLNGDPSSDDYRFFADEAYNGESGLLPRYKYMNGPDGNSPIQNTGAVTSGTSIPDAEDLNKDNTMNENEEYFQYQVDLYPGMDVSNNKYIISKVTTADNAVNFYQFRIPIREFDAKVGSIPDFRSIQFMRMFMTGFSDSVALLRFATLDLVRNQWRKYTYAIDPGFENTPIDPDALQSFSVQKVSIEENSDKSPVNYVLPPNIERTQTIGAQTNQPVQQNEQALSLVTCGLQDGKSRAVFKNMSIDVRRYKHLKMYIHGNSKEGETPVKDGDVVAFVRIGSDFTNNYYQYEVPLHMTQPNTRYNGNNNADRDSVWPEQNNVDISLEDLVNIKLTRNAKNGYPHGVPFTQTINGRIYSVVGNPDIGSVKVVMLGIKNPQAGDPNNPKPDDDGLSKCVEVWFNELRVSDLDERGGTAAVGEVSVKLADLGKVSVTGGMHTRGFGQIEQKVDQRFKDDMYQYSVTSNLEIGKLLPQKAGIRIPFFGSIAQTFSTPEFDPYQKDIPVAKEITALETLVGKDSARAYKKQIQTITTRKGYNFSGVRFAPKLKAKKPQIYDPGNFNFTYAYTELTSSDPFVQTNTKRNYVGQIAWAYSPQPFEVTPFKKLIKTKTHWLDLIKDFNFNLLPSTLSFSTDVLREFGKIKLRNLGDAGDIPATYNKFFKWNRVYAFKYNPFKSLSIEYNAINNARIDEPDGEIDTKEKKDFIWNNFKKGGRNTNFSQNFSVNYQIPINKFPVFDFITANAGYAATYGWVAAPQVRDTATNYYKQNPLGNVINNSQNIRGKADLNFRKLYDKVPFLKVYNAPNPNLGDRKENAKKREAVFKAREKIQKEIDVLKEKRQKLRDERDNLAKLNLPDSVEKAKRKVLRAELKEVRKQIRAKRKDYYSKQFPSNTYISMIIRPLLSLKKITVEYKENKTTTLAGFMPSPNLLGNNTSLAAPGYDFAFGWQPGEHLFADRNDAARRDAWLDRAAARGWISGDTLLNQKFVQTRQSRIDVTANFEPFSDLKVDLNLYRDFTVTENQFFKKTSENGGWEHLNPMQTGQFSMSYVPVNTFFAPIDKKGLSQTYRDFENNRAIISERLGAQNDTSKFYGSYKNPVTGENTRYSYGYGPKSVDVLVPAFLAAYTRQDAHKINTNVFKQMPLPNWRISYNGLSKIKWLQKVFTNVNITHGYTSTLTVSNFSTNLDAQINNGNPTRVDTISGNYYSALAIPSVSINESFSPLIGIDMTFKNQVSARFDYKKSRTLTMNFADYQMIENNSSTFTFGAGYTVRGLRLPIKIKGKLLRLDNDLKFKLDVSYRDAVVINHRIDETTPQLTSGATNITISPAIDYVISQRMNVRVFVDYNKTIPKISTSFETTNIRGGIQFRFTLVN